MIHNAMISIALCSVTFCPFGNIHGHCLTLHSIRLPLTPNRLIIRKERTKLNIHPMRQNQGSPNLIMKIRQCRIRPRFLLRTIIIQTFGSKLCSDRVCSPLSHYRQMMKVGDEFRRIVVVFGLKILTFSVGGEAVDYCRDGYGCCDEDYYYDHFEFANGLVLLLKRSSNIIPILHFLLPLIIIVIIHTTTTTTCRVFRMITISSRATMIISTTTGSNCCGYHLTPHSRTSCNAGH
mmetsp:Transcript_19385/g.29921  ORF Transcript_19385/g.29921 Transcript_19385/m.29921 type:complete len:235 (+) Transcript_19385:3704-4408(+)